MDSNSVLSCSDAEEITVIAEPSQTGLAKKSFFSASFIFSDPLHVFKLTQRCSKAHNLDSYVIAGTTEMQGHS